jgi:MFS family permease
MTGWARRLADQPGLPRQAGAYLLARLPSGMFTFALLLCVHDRTRSFARAGAVVAGYSVAVALCAPFVGRAADRWGTPVVLLLAALVHLAGLLSVVEAGAQLPVLLGGAVLAGAGLPPSAAALRATWRSLPDGIRQSVFALDGVVIELAHVVGPLLVAAATALVSPTAALVTAGALIVLGALATAAVLPAGAGAPAARGRRMLGPISVPGVAVLLALLAIVTVALGLVEVSAVAFGTGRHEAALPGYLLAAMSAGSMAGGLVYAARPSRRPLPSVLRALCAASAVGLAVLPAGRNPWLLAILLAITNVVVAPLLAVLFTLLGERTPDDVATETFAWASSSNFAAIGLGSAAGGALVNASTPGWTFAGAALVMGLAAGIASLPAMRRATSVRAQAAR